MAKVKEIVPVPKTGPSLTIRVRDKGTISKIKQAADKTGLSMNSWIVEVLERAAGAQ